MIQSEIEVSAIKSLRLVRSNTFGANGDKSVLWFKMADFLLDLGHGSKRLFCASWHDVQVYRISLFSDNLEGGAKLSKFSRGRYTGIKPRPFMKIITFADSAMLKEHMKFGKGQSRGSEWKKIFNFIAPPRTSPLAMVNQFQSIKSEQYCKEMYEIWCKSVHGFMRYNFFIIIAPPTGETPQKLTHSLTVICGIHV